MLKRRSLLTGAVSLLAAPAIIRVADLMSIRVVPDTARIGTLTRVEDIINPLLFLEYAKDGRLDQNFWREVSVE